MERGFQGGVRRGVDGQGAARPQIPPCPCPIVAGPFLRMFLHVPITGHLFIDLEEGGERSVSYSGSIIRPCTFWMTCTVKVYVYGTGPLHGGMTGVFCEKEVKKK